MKYHYTTGVSCISYALYATITADLLNVCGRYREADIDLWPISPLHTWPIWSSMWPIWFNCGRYRCNSSLFVQYVTAHRFDITARSLNTIKVIIMHTSCVRSWTLVHRNPLDVMLCYVTSCVAYCNALDLDTNKIYKF